MGLIRYALALMTASLTLAAQGVTSEHELRLFNQSNPASSINLSASFALSTSYTLTLPPAQGSANSVLASDASGALSWSAGVPSALNALTNAVATNSITSGAFPQTWTWNTLAGNTAMTINDSRTLLAGPSSADGLFISGCSGENTAGSKARSLLVENLHTGTAATNIGITTSASGGSVNIALYTLQGACGFLLGTDVMPQANVHIGPGTATLAPLKFTSGTNLTTAEISSVEYDGNVFYTTNDAQARGVLPSKYFVILNADNTLTSSTTAQPIFDGGGGTTDGAIDVPVGLYEFEMLVHLTNLSVTSGMVEFSFAGTSTRNSFIWKSIGGRFADVATSGDLRGRFYSSRQALATDLSAAQTIASGWYYVTGMLRVSGAGTVIPQLRLTVASAAVVQNESYFKMNRLGTNTVANVGRWK